MHSRRVAAVCALAWAMAVAVALAVTLRSLSHDDFDGLNNLWQIPFALPWFLIPTGSNHVVNAWIAAAMGWINAVILFLWLSRRQSLRRA